ncbi:MAG: hypothetical protein COA82_03580 [Alkaliphilus sp.]|nr:MAG: hypothetical protein COA82_03580 [Alkaliphilus sp.]
MKNILETPHGNTTSVKCRISFIDATAIVSNKNGNAGKFAVHLLEHSNSDISVIALSMGQLRNIAKACGLSGVPALIRIVNASQKQAIVLIDYIACRKGEEFAKYGDEGGTGTYLKDWWKAEDFTIEFPDAIQDVLTQAQVTSAVALDEESFTTNVSASMTLGEKLRAANAARRARATVNPTSEAPVEETVEEVVEETEE